MNPTVGARGANGLALLLTILVLALAAWLFRAAGRVHGMGCVAVKTMRPSRVML